MRRRAGKIVALWRGMFLGWLVGAGVALVAAPRRGQETRAMLREKGIDLQERAAEKFEEMQQRALQLARSGMERASRFLQQGDSVISEQIIGLQSAMEGVREGLRSYQEQAQAERAARQGETKPNLPAIQKDAPLNP